MTEHLRPLLFSSLLLTLVFGFSQSSQAELRYTPKVGATHAYSVEIIAELPNATETSKGIIVYTVKEQKDDQLTLDYQGGLGKSSKAKGNAGGRGPGFVGRPSFPPNPFSTPTFKGLTQTTNQLTLSTQGDVLEIKGSSQLPYLLGNLSTLIFEPFPAERKTEWEWKNGIAITETNERQSFPRFGPGGPFGSTPTEGKRSAGMETTAYKIKGSENDQVTIEKTYALESPEVDGKAREITGQGTWVFDESKAFPQKIDFQQTLVLKSNNITVKVPVTLQVEALSEMELAEHQKAQEKRQAEAKARLAELQAKNKAKRDAPLTEKQKTEVLVKLDSNDFFEVLRGLNTLRFKNPPEPDADIAAALKKLEDHKNPNIRRQAQDIGKKWSVPAKE